MRRFNGITLKIGGDTSSLKKALREPSKECNDLQSRLKTINQLIDHDPSNIEYVAQKQKLLAEAVNKTKEKLTMLKDAQKQFVDSNGDVTSKGYLELEQEIQITENKLKSLNKEQSNLNNNLKAVGDKLGEVGPKITSAGKGMLKVSGALVTAGAGAVHFASDAEESANKVDVAFGNSSDEIKKFADTTLEQFGIARGSALDMTSLFGDMATSMGLPKSEAADMSMSLTGLAGDLSSFKNIGIDQAMTALNGVFTGETESLKTIGIVMTQTNLDAFALANGFGKTTKEMTEAEKVQLRYAYIMDKTKNAQGDFARTSDGTANSLRVFKESLKELAENLGSVLLPVVSKVVGKINKWIINFNKMDDKTKAVIVTVGALVAGIGPLLLIIGTLCSSVSKVIGLIELVKEKQLLMNMQALGPTTLKIMAIVAVIGTLIYAFQHWDEICAWFTGQWKSFTKSWTKDWNSFKDWFNKIGKNITGFFKKLPSSLYKNGKDAIDKFASGIESKLGLPKGSVKRLLSSIKNSFVSFATRPFEWGLDMIKGFADGISSGFRWVKDKVDDVTGWISRHLHFSVPDEGPLADADEWGPDFMNLLADGIDRNKHKVFDEIQDVARGLQMKSDINSQVSEAISSQQTVHVYNHNVLELDGKEIFTNNTERATQYTNILNAYEGV